MSLYVITPATDSVVSLSEAKSYLRVDHTDDDAVISAMIAAVTDWAAGPNGWLGRSLAPQTLELRMPGFPSYCFGGIILPKPPLIAVESVKYLDTEGVEQTLDSGLYLTYVDGAGMSRVSPEEGESWPATATHPEAVRVRYTAGYIDGQSPPQVAVPGSIKQAFLATLASIYDGRESGLSVDDKIAKRFFSPFKVYA